MAHTAHTTPANVDHRSIAEHISAPFIAVYHALIRVGEADPRYNELVRLSAMTDAELAKLGLRRETLATHVLRGRLLL